MKLSTFTAKLTCIKSKLVPTLAAAIVAGAAVFAAAPAASAQQLAFGVQLGGPRYVAPGPPSAYGYYGPRYDARRERDAWARQQDWRREQEWRRRENGRREEGFRFHGDSYGRDSRNFGYRP